MYTPLHKHEVYIVQDEAALPQVGAEQNLYIVRPNAIDGLARIYEWRETTYHRLLFDKEATPEAPEGDTGELRVQVVEMYTQLPAAHEARPNTLYIVTYDTTAKSRTTMYIVMNEQLVRIAVFSGGGTMQTYVQTTKFGITASAANPKVFEFDVLPTRNFLRAPIEVHIFEDGPTVSRNELGVTSEKDDFLSNPLATFEAGAIKLKNINTFTLAKKNENIVSATVRKDDFFRLNGLDKVSGKSLILHEGTYYQVTSNAIIPVAAALTESELLEQYGVSDLSVTKRKLVNVFLPTQQSEMIANRKMFTEAVDLEKFFDVRMTSVRVFRKNGVLYGLEEPAFVPDTSINVALNKPTQSSGSTGNYIVANIIDGTSNKIWISDVSHHEKILWVSVDLQRSVLVNRYDIRTPQGHASGTPRTWTFQGSNDNRVWTDLHVGSNSSVVASAIHHYSFVNTKYFRYYRLYKITRDQTKQKSSIAELQIFESKQSGEWQLKQITTDQIVNYPTTPGTLYPLPPNFYTLFGDNVEMFDYTSNTATNATITLYANYSPLDELDGAFEVITQNAAETLPLQVYGMPKEALVIQERDTALLAVKKIKKIDVPTYLTGNSYVYVAVSFDKGTAWHYWNGEAFEVIDLTTSALKQSGAAASVVNQIPEAAWEQLRAGSTTVRFAYLLGVPSENAQVEVRGLYTTVEMEGSWKIAVHGREYEYEYSSDSRIIMTLLADGDYKINA